MKVSVFGNALNLGVTTLELMPLASFPGTRNWGYDGVSLFAPARAYGGADSLRRLVDAAHAQGLAVILDVVYNHLGPVGNYLGRFAAEKLFLAKSKRELSLLKYTAKERYLRLFSEQPKIIQLIPMKYIASYIGITPQGLSRIRRQIC